jgi:aspartyl-tRNA(Asn)/glutamyl-tRNA(Gln) amidotransferase subunit C
MFSMSIDITTVKKLAELSRLDVTEEEVNQLVGELGSILDYVSQINGALTEEIELQYSTVNVLREDSVTTQTGIYTENLLALAPQSEKGFVKVKKIL